MSSPAKSPTRTFYNHSNDPWFKNQSIESCVTVKPVPDYLKQRQGKFGDNKASSKDERTQRKLEMSLDPLDPANSPKHMRGPKAFGSLPVPVVYLLDVAVKKTRTKNKTGQSVLVSRVGKVAKVLKDAEQRAEEAMSMRSEVKKDRRWKRKERKKEN
ncbi:unnamed protein product [Microthlaspi erraticum]|uniref:Uncharacterized protein n=1 Tax=Microthlaspi erraticum TaxID=1685480 RepID=A0A6D2JHI3_9BRAS|nr:unnamed protein product [Microthlaspi erraticum]